MADGAVGDGAPFGAKERGVRLMADVDEVRGIQSADWLLCACWQAGRCLTDCPSARRADRPRFGSWWWDRHTGEWITASEGTVRNIQRAEARED